MSPYGLMPNPTAVEIIERPDEPQHQDRQPCGRPGGGSRTGADGIALSAAQSDATASAP